MSKEKVTEKTLCDMNGEKLVLLLEEWQNAVLHSKEPKKTLEAKEQVNLIKKEIINRCNIILML